MTKQFQELFPSISKMSDEDLMNQIGEIRRRKYTERPAKVNHEKAERAPAAKRNVSKVSKLLGGMSEEQRLSLIKLLEGES